LITHFLDKYNALYSRDFSQLSPEIIGKLVSFDWPGNVRQLENMIKQVVVRGDELIIAELIQNSRSRVPGMSTSGQLAGIPQTPSLPEDDGADPADYSLKDRIGRVVAREEKRLIAEVLAKTNWNRRKASEMLDISYRSLLYKIKDYNLNATK